MGVELGVETRVVLSTLSTSLFMFQSRDESSPPGADLPSQNVKPFYRSWTFCFSALRFIQNYTNAQMILSPCNRLADSPQIVLIAYQSLSLWLWSPCSMNSMYPITTPLNSSSTLANRRLFSLWTVQQKLQSFLPRMSWYCVRSLASGSNSWDSSSLAASIACSNLTMHISVLVSKWQTSCWVMQRGQRGRRQPTEWLQAYH